MRLINDVLMKNKAIINELSLIIGIVGGHSIGLHSSGRVLLETGGRVFLLEQEDRIIWIGNLWNRSDDHWNRFSHHSGKSPPPQSLNWPHVMVGHFFIKIVAYTCIEKFIWASKNLLFA
jgi:hypothetical protein